MVDVAAYASLEAFLQDNSNFLEAREAENSVLLGNALRARGASAAYEGGSYWVAGPGDDQPDLLASLNSHHLLLAAIGPAAVPAAGHLARALRAGGWQVPSVIGRDAVADSYAEHWRGLSGTEARLQRRLRVYELRQVTRRAPSRGRLRPANLADLPRIATWAEAFEQEALGERETWDTMAYARQRITAGEICVWEDGEPVSMAGQARPTPHGMTINLVYTPPEARGLGYASSCVAALSQLLLDEGRQFCTLSADVANPTANGIYERMGYRPVCDFHHIVFEF